MGLRDFYYSMENKYYGLLDKLDKSGLKVYKVVDKIDKVIPSFVLVIILFGLIIVGIILGLIFTFGINFPNDPVTFVFQDKYGENFSNQLISYSFNGVSQGYLETTNLGTISFESAKTGDVFEFEIPKGNDYESITRTISKEKTYTIRLNFALSEDSVNFSVKSVDGSALRPINIDFSCANPNAVKPKSIVSSTEEYYNISLSSDCGVLSVSIKSNYYSEAYQEVYDGSTVNLRPNDYSGNIQINVNVYDEFSLPITGDASVSLSQNGIPLKVANKVSNGVYNFTGLAPATYTVNVTKNGYASQNQTVILTGSSTNENISFYLKATSGLGNFKIQIVDVDAKALSNVDLILYSQTAEGNQKEIVSQGKTDSLGFVTLNVPDISQKYWLIGKKSLYTPLSIKNLQVPESQLTLVMRRNNDKEMLRIKVLDEFDFPINNASVALMDANDNVIVPYFGVTDFNGIVKNSVDDGTYKVYAYKGSFSGMSNLFSYARNTITANDYVIVNLAVPKAGWDITLKDSFGMPVPNALVTLYDAYNFEPIEIGNKYASPEGFLSIQNLRVDRKYFAVISAKSFENYISKSKFLIANSLVNDTFVMEKEKLDRKINIESIGTFDLENNKVYKFASDEEYVSRFKITLPANSDLEYDNLVANFVLGDLDSVEKDYIYVSKIETSGNSTLIKGRNYDETNVDKSIGDTRSFDDIIYDGSPFQDQIKWVQVQWDLSSHNITSGILFVDVYMKVKPGVKEGTNTKLSFNTFAKAKKNYYSKEGEIIDLDTLGLFLKNKNQIFFTVGAGQQVCDDLFCFEGSFLDLKDDLRSSVMGELPYISKLGRNYNLSFRLVNNRNIPLTNYRIIIENLQQNLEMKSGIIYTVNDLEFNKPNNMDFTDYFKYTFFGNVEFRQNSAIRGDIDFIPIKEGSSSFKITVIEDREIIYTKEFFVSVVANKEILVEFDPEVIPSYVDAEIEFTVKDADNNAYLEDAFVRIVNVYDSELASGTTDKFGKVALDINAQNPNTDLYMKVYKENYKAFEKAVRTSDKFILIDPKELNIKANVFEMKGQGVLNLKNTSQLPVVIESITIEGNFDEYVNVLETQNYLDNTSLNKELDKEHSYDIPINVSLTNIASYLKESIEYPGKLIIKVKPKDIDKTRSWDYEVPLSLYISLGKGLDNLDCLSVDKAKSEIISNNGKNDSDSLTVVNGCTVNNVPVKIRNLEAKITWKGNALGAFTFVKNEISSRIQSAYYVTLLTTMLDHQESMFILNFNPATGRIAGTNTAEIELRASYFTDNGIEFITAKTEYKVSVIDMQSCITYDLPDQEVDLIKVPKDGKAQFKIRNDCDTGFSLRLADLPAEFIDVRPKEFDLPAKSEVVVNIEPNNSPVGVYLLEVRGAVPKASFNGVRVGQEALRVFVAPLETDCLVMDNYEFNFAGLDESKYAYLINRCYYKDVTALYDIKVKANDDCLTQNITSILKSAVGGLAASAISGYGYGSLLGNTNKGTERKETPNPANDQENIGSQLESAEAVAKVLANSSTVPDTLTYDSKFRSSNESAQSTPASTESAPVEDKTFTWNIINKNFTRVEIDSSGTITVDGKYVYEKQSSTFDLNIGGKTVNYPMYKSKDNQYFTNLQLENGSYVWARVNPAGSTCLDSAGNAVPDCSTAQKSQYLTNDLVSFYE